MLVRAYTYIRSMGASGLREISENAVINANYILSQLKDYYHLPFTTGRVCTRWYSQRRRQKAKGVSALDIAKRLIDHGIHPPTMYFPLVVDEALMIEPTECESKETLEYFIEVMKSIAREVDEDPDVVKSAPHFTPNSRLDEARAARRPDLGWRPAGE